MHGDAAARACRASDRHSPAYSELPEPVSTMAPGRASPFTARERRPRRAPRGRPRRAAVSSQVTGCWQISRRVWRVPARRPARRRDAARRPPTRAPGKRRQRRTSAVVDRSRAAPPWVSCNPLIDSKGNGAYKRKRLKAIEMKRKSQSPRPDPRRRLDSLSVGHGKRVRLWRMLYGHGPAQRHPARAAPRPGARARARRLLPTTRPPSTPTSSSAWPWRATTPRSRSASASPRST